ncbi:hypothetical protein [Peribacillus deserti]|uniref:Uncharacterized protein n=1 Tax=Peribacillus deserti TaxID=673318 RepID=A0A2N5LZV2_9BACI|nr:hypothetical protein [Peribacillus deserti]PLT27649.1 hypothetical protein CUU66_22805 [Peribacillus deserti]
MHKQKNHEFLTQAPKKTELTIETDDSFPNPKNYPGDSVNEHKELELGNAIIGAKEIGQQNENL